jgi:hypothetical protein
VVASVYVFNHVVSLTVYVESLDQVSRGVHYFYLGEKFYVITAAFLRITVGLLLLRIAHTRAQRITIYAAILFMVLISTAFLGVVIFQCSPVEWYWDYSPADISKGHCFNRNIIKATANTHASISFASDWVLGLMPVWLLWTVQISRNKKIGVAFMLSLGLLSGVAAIIRVFYIEKLDAANFEKNWIGLALCSVIEPGLGIIAASVAAFRPVFATQWFQSLSSKISSRDTAKPSRSSVPSWRKKDKPVGPGVTGTTLGDTQKDGSMSTMGGTDEEKGITVHTQVTRTVEYE